LKNDNAGSHDLLKIDKNELKSGQTIERVVDGQPPLSLIIGRRENHFFAYINLCPHAGRAMDYAPGKFLFNPDGHLVCPIHGATFEMNQGICLGGPCPGAQLTSVPIKEDGEQIIVGPAKAPAYY